MQYLRRLRRQLRLVRVVDVDAARIAVLLEVADEAKYVQMAAGAGTDGRHNPADHVRGASPFQRAWNAPALRPIRLLDVLEADREVDAAPAGVLEKPAAHLPDEGRQALAAEDEQGLGELGDQVLAPTIIENALPMLLGCIGRKSIEDAQHVRPVRRRK